MNRNASLLVVAMLVVSTVAALITVLPGRAGALTGGPDAYGYTYDDTAPFSWIPAAGIVIADAPTACQNPPGGNDFAFGSFTFYGVGYNNIMVCPNGFVKFVGALNTGTTANSALPNSAIPNADIIGLAYTGLDPTMVGSGKIWYEEQATQSVVTWDNVNISSIYQVQFQIILKDTGVIDIQYNSVPSNYAGVTSGIESSLGDIGLQYSGSSAPGRLLDGVNVRYSPPAPPVADVLTISGEDHAPANVQQTEAVLLERYILSTGTGAIAIKEFRIGKLGTVQDANVRFRIYNDTNNNSAYDSGVDQMIMSSTTPTAGVAIVTFSTPQLVTPTSTQRWLVIADCQCAAVPGNTLGVRISSAIPSVILAGIDSATYSPASPIDSSLATVVALPASTLSFTYSDRAPATVTQGQVKVILLDMTATVDVGSLRLTRINVTLTGLPPRDEDISRLYLFADDNEDGAYQVLIDREISTTTFSAGIAAFYPWLIIYGGAANSVRFLIAADISSSAIPGDTLGVRIAASTEVMADTCNAVISSANFPVASSNSLVVAGVPNTVTIDSWSNLAPATAYVGDTILVMANFTLSVDVGVARITNPDWINITLTGIPPDPNDIAFGPMGQVALYDDVDADGLLTLDKDMRLGGGWFSGGPPFDYVARIMPFMAPIEIFAGEARSFLLTYGISNMATVGNSVGVRIDNVSSMRFETLTLLSSTNLPLQSLNTVIQANASDVLTMSIANLAPLTAPPFAQGVLMGSITLDVPVGLGSNYVEVRNLAITRFGTSSDTDVFAVGVYHDVDGDSLLDPYVDQFLGAGEFFGNMAWISFDPMFGWSGFRVAGGTPESLLLVLDLSPTATPLATIGLRVNATSDVNIDMMTGDSVSPMNFPLSTGLLTVRGITQIPSLSSPWTPSPPTIDGSIPAGEWADATHVDLSNIMGNRLQTHMYIKNDVTNLYIAYDVIGDRTLDFEDWASISFDTGNDDIGSDGMESMFSSGGWSELYQNHRVYDSITGSWVVEDAPFDQSLPDHATLDMYRGFSQTPMAAYAHPIIEFQIPLALLAAMPGDTIGFAAAAPAGSSPGGVSNSAGFSFAASWPLAFGPMMGYPLLEEYGDLTLGLPPIADVNVVGFDRAPAVVARGQNDVLMMGLTMTANVPLVTLNALNITLAGSGTDTDVASVWLYDDIDDDGLLNLGIDVPLAAAMPFSNGYANFTGLVKDIAGGTPEQLLIVYDIAPTATLGATLGARLLSNLTVVFAGGATVAGVFPMTSTNSRVNAPPTTANLVVNGFAAATAGIMHIVTPPNDPSLGWTYADGDGEPQSEYRVQVWTGPLGTGVLMWDPPTGAGPTSSVAYGGTPLVDGATYYFRVDVFDGWEWSGWTEVQFRINTPPPAPSFPTNPIDDEVVPATAAQTVSWEDVVDAEGDLISFSWQVEENGTCTFAVLYANGIATSNESSSFPTAISSGYCWRVESNDSWEVSGWSASWNFTTNIISNNPPALTLPSVSPATGTGTTMFTYSVRYSDPDNDSPEPSTFELWIEKGGVPVAGAPFAMVPGAWVGAPNDYTAGRDFSYATTLPLAGIDYTYYFMVADVWGASASTAVADAPDVTNTAPTLGWVGAGSYLADGLDPEVGTTATVFTFRIVYSDFDNDTPVSIDVVIENPLGTPWGTLAMTWESWVGAPDDYVAGAVYVVTTTISPSGRDYVYSFTASDGIDSASGAPTIPTNAPDVDNPPIADGRAWPGLSGSRNTVFVFDAANSTDDFSIVSWLWDFGDGNNLTTEKVSHTYASLGSFTVNLTVLDDSGQSAMDSMLISVTNLPPTAQAAVSPSSTGYLTTLFTFDASASIDPDGTIVSYDWDFGDSSTGAGIIATHTYSAKQTFTVTLTVTDSDGEVDQTTLTIDVVNRAPVITSSSPSAMTLNMRVNADETLSVVANDPDGDVLVYSWRMDLQPVGTDSSSHGLRFSTPGVHIITVSVTDGLETVTRTWTVTVLAEEYAWWMLVLLIAIIVIVIIVILLVYLLTRRRKSKKEGAGPAMPGQQPLPPPPQNMPPQTPPQQFQPPPNQSPPFPPPPPPGPLP